MTPFDARRIDALARALRLPPRRLLVAAARLAAGAADADATGRAQRRRAVLADARAASPAAESCAALLLAPVAGHARDDIDRALAALWPSRPGRSD